MATRGRDPAAEDVLEISALTARRYVMGRGGLWPGRRWRGIPGTRTAMRAMEDLQLDPLVVVARDLPTAGVLRMGRLARRPADGRAAVFPGPDEA